MATRPFPDLVVSVGEEGSDPIVSHEGRDHRVDEYALSGHLARMNGDLADVAALQVSLKLSSLTAHFTPLDPDGTLARVRPALEAVAEAARRVVSRKR